MEISVSNPQLLTPTSHLSPPAEARGEGRKAPTAADPVTCGQQNLPVPPSCSLCPLSGGDGPEGPPWPSSIAGSLPATIE